MGNLHSITLALIGINILVSFIGFSNDDFFKKFKFNIDSILIRKEYFRILSSGFLHANWMHLIFNMISLLLFSNLVIDRIGPLNFSLIYFSSLIAGELLSLFIHRNNGDYSSIGASGAVNGIIFSAIALHPGMQMSLILIPVFVPAWLFGFIIIIVSIYGIKSNSDNIGHDSHLGGAIIGMLVTICLFPSIIEKNYLTILVILIPAIAFIILIIRKPHILIIDWKLMNQKKSYFSIDEKYNDERLDKTKEMDRILDKIGKKGINSLSVREKEFLDKNSK